MRERVQIIEVNNDVADGIGGFTTTKTTVATVWARIEMQDGSRYGQYQTVENMNQFNITMRTGSYNLTTNNLINWKGQEYTIISVAKDEQYRFTKVLAWKQD